MSKRKIKASARKKSWYSILAKGSNSADVMIYEEIGYFGVTAKEFARDIQSLGNVGTLNVFINSVGGSVIEGTAIYNILKNHPASVNVQIDGVALSMGSLIAMAGDTIGIAENGLMMIHNPQGGASGESKDLRKTAEVMDKMKENMVNTYASKSGMDADTIADLMDQETWMTASEAVDMGFADNVTGAVDLAATFDPEKFDNVPSHILATLIKEPQYDQSAKSKMSAVAGSTQETLIMTEEERKKAAEAKAKAEAEAKAEVIAKQAAADALAKDKERRTAIRNSFTPHGSVYRDLLDACLDDDTITVEDARTKLLEAIGTANKASATQHDTHITVVADARDKFVAGASQALAIRAGKEKDDGTNNFRGHTLLDIAKESLRINNVSINSMDKMRIVGAAFTHTSSDFPYLLENTLGKELQRAYGIFPQRWRDVALVGSVPDFKVNSRIRLGSFNSLATVPEGGEYSSGTFGEEKETIQAATKGKLISLTRQMIINDDLNGFMRIATLLGNAAGRTVNTDVFGILTNNAALSDGIALFHASHANLAASGAAPTLALIGSAKTAMRKQMDPDANDYLDINPTIVVCGVELEDTLKTLIASETDPSQSNSKKPNIYRNSLTVISDPNLNATEWYLLADPAMVPTMEIAFLDGNETPYLESENGFTVDGTRWKVRLDYGYTGNDFRGGYKNPGV